MAGITRRTTIVAKGRLSETGKLTTGAPVTAKTTGVAALETLSDTVVTESANGAVAQYNADQQRYEIKPLLIETIAGTLDIDLGTF